ncbi:MAG: protein translocase subunit SecD, partial [Candidatus Levyibacteriota bacterium]
MRRSARTVFWLIALLTIVSVWINFPIGQDKVFKFLRSDKALVFREGLDLQGGSSMTYRADMKNISSDQRANALESAKTIIEKRVNLFGVSEPVINTAITNGDYRVILELPGVDINQAKKIVGTTAELSFWEQGIASASAQEATPAATLEKTNLGGKDLKSTSVVFDPNTGKPQVQLVFTSEGSRKFADITERNIGKVLAIILDGEIIQTPVVNQKIVGGSAVIEGGFTTETAAALSTQLNAGALPVPLVLLEEHTVGPTLGRDALQKSIFAGILGFITIVIFMTALYGRHGVVASLALLLYVIFTLSIFKLSNLTPYGITLTLSGIAGFVLSVGMAVDANVLIFERMKEEKRLGKSPQTVVELGFSRAWSSIKDSNISTLITSLILYQFGTGAVRGFALVLAIGVMVSMFSAIVVTRTFLRFLYGHNR